MKSEPLASSPWARSRWLVVAPHPDDETLGTGALIADTARDGRLGGIVYLTDGTGSHPPGTPRLASIRRAEARNAIRRLTMARIRIERLGWQDAHPHATDSARFDRDAGRLGAALRHHHIDAIAVTGPGERHCDHVAAFRLAEAAIARARRRIALFIYCVWGEPPAGCRQRLETRGLASGTRRHALAAHRSQISSVYGEGFQLSRSKRLMPRSDTLFLQEPAR